MTRSTSRRPRSRFRFSTSPDPDRSRRRRRRGGLPPPAAASAHAAAGAQRFGRRGTHLGAVARLADRASRFDAERRGAARDFRARERRTNPRPQRAHRGNGRVPGGRASHAGDARRLRVQGDRGAGADGRSDRDRSLRARRHRRRSTASSRARLLAVRDARDDCVRRRAARVEPRASRQTDRLLRFRDPDRRARRSHHRDASGLGDRRRRRAFG